MMPGFGFLVLLLLGGVALALALGGAGWLRRTRAFRPSNEQRQPTPRELLDERFARGEIDQDEYEAIRARLES
jgi:putative membrane protein